MKLVSYLSEDREQLAFYHNACLYHTDLAHPELPATMALFLARWEDFFPIAQQVNEDIVKGNITVFQARHSSGTPLLSPVPHPASCRDGYAFRQHVAAARRNRKADMIPEFDQYPIFYFTNHQSIQGEGPVTCMPDHFEKLDFELEAAIVVCKKGRNFLAEEADAYIGGLMIMNDLSARRLQMEEMLLNLGPAKGKDFSTVLGPWLVTLDELAPYEVPPKPGHTGKSWNLPMSCSVNGIQVSNGNLADMDWTFAELLERCAYGADVFPGDVIGSGTVGTGCFLELNGTARLKNPAAYEQWLQPGDTVTLDIEALGTLTNVMIAADTSHSLLALKKTGAQQKQ